ncbi:MAG: nuclear transport factor 2 family protein [Acidobacteria bacterium]|nr:nuclear transport factor 2 family protein [Acidobacteriota bacterium]
MKKILLYVCAAGLAAQLGCSKPTATNAPANANSNPTLQATPPANGAATPVNPTALPPPPTTAPSMPPPSQSNDMTLQMTASDFHAAILQGRKTDVESMVADNYKGTQPDGSSMNKQQLLASLKEAKQMFSLNAGKPEVKGDTATITGTYTLNSMDKPEQGGKTYQFTDTYRKQGGKWLVASSVVTEQKK